MEVFRYTSVEMTALALRNVTSLLPSVWPLKLFIAWMRLRTTGAGSADVDAKESYL